MDIAKLAVVAATVCCLAGCGRARTGPEAVVIGAPYEMMNLDPHAEDTLSSAAMLGNVYEPLVASDPELKSQPCLATSWESPDARTWIFHLRRDVRFHSGRAFTSKDVVYSLRRLMATEPFYNKGHLYDVAEVADRDPMTVTIRSRGSKRSLLNSLRWAPIVPEGSTDEALQSHADGTGPYEVEAWDPGRSLRLVRNDGYWSALPALSRVEYRLGQSSEAAAAGLVEGRYGLVQANSRDAAALFARSDRIATLRRDSLFVQYLAFDLCRDSHAGCATKPSPFRDLRVRQALDLAVDRRSLAQDVPAAALPATEIVPRFVFGFDPGVEEARFDPVRARSLLKEAGFGKGLSATLLSRRILEAPALILKAQLARVGVELDVRILGDADFFAAQGRRDVPLCLDRNACLTGDAGEMLNALARSGRADPALRAAIARSEEVEDVEERRAELQSLIRQVRDDLPLVPLYRDEGVFGLERSFAWKPRADGLIRAAEIGRAPTP